MTVAAAGTPTRVRLPGELKQQIEAIREDERRSLNAQIIVLLEEAVAARGADTPAAPPTHRAGAPDTPARPGRTRPRPCVHRVEKGAFCKRCQRVIS